MARRIFRAPSLKQSKSGLGRVGNTRVDDFRLLRLDAGNADTTRLFLLGDHPGEVDMQQAILKASAFHFDVVGKLEAALKGAPRNALKQKTAFRLFCLAAFAGDG